MSIIFAINLEYLRRSRNLTQKAIATKLAISRGAYSKYETGERDPKIDTLVALMDVLEVDANNLLDSKCAVKRQALLPELRKKNRKSEILCQVTE